jgi:hypothetical protein
VTIINTTTPAAGRRWAYTGIILGGTVSIAANVAHSFIPPHGAPAGWHPQPGAVVGAIVWPVFLFIAIEIMARTTWPTGPQWGLLRWGGLLPVAAVAAFVSYRHLSGLLAFYGEDHLVVILGPLAIDGLMAMATGALFAATHTTMAEPVEPTAVAPVPVVDPATTLAEPVHAGELADIPAHLIPTARFAVTNHEVTTGHPITAPELAARMSIPAATADRLLAQLRAENTDPVPVRVNGFPIVEAQR